MALNEASSVDVRLKVTVLREIVDPNDRCGEPRSGAEAERPARAEAAGDPTDDGRPDGGAAQDIARRIAITRPRMTGSVDSCTKLFVAIVKL